MLDPSRSQQQVAWAQYSGFVFQYRLNVSFQHKHSLFVVRMNVQRESRSGVDTGIYHR